MRFSFKGYYKNWFFRSLKELSYVLHLESVGSKWSSAEIPSLTVTYTDVYGKTKKHYADLLVDNRIIVEVKPRRYQNSKTVKLKSEAMKDFCAKNGYVYSMVSPRKINKQVLKSLYVSGAVTIQDCYKKKFEKYLG
jgi:hypothetical protein